MEIKMRSLKELPYSMNAIPQVYHYYTFGFGILKACNKNLYEKYLCEEIQNIFYGQNLQIYMNNIFNWNIFKFEFLDKSSYEVSIKLSIDKGKYVHLDSIDYFFIPNRKATMKGHYFHDLLIIGYDEEDFICVGYNYNNIFAKQYINKSCIGNSLNSNTQIRSIYCRETAVGFIDHSRVINSLRSYCYSYKPDTLFQCFTEANDFKTWVYGIEALSKGIDALADSNDLFFYHNIQLGIEIREINKIKFLHLISDSYHMDIIREYENLIEINKGIKRMIIKKNIMKDMNFINERKKMEFILDEEIKIIRNILKICNVES